MKILDGRVVRDKIAEKLETINKKPETRAKLVIFQVGDLAESNVYISQKIKFGQKIGAIVNHQKLPIDIPQEELISKILTFNSDPSVHGIIVQLPIPNRLDKDKIIDEISPVKDIDGQTSTNIKKLFEGDLGGYLPATTRGILTLCDYYKISPAGKHVVVVGRSTLVGKPTAIAFLNRDATVTICHSKTRNLKLETRNADILVVAAGRPKLITHDYVKPGQIIIDVGINVIDNKKPETGSKKLAGDVDFDSVSQIAGAITPVPGGIGPLTVASLFENLMEAYTKINIGN